MGNRGYFFPRQDDAFEAWSVNYLNALKGWWSAQGLDLKDLNDLDAATVAYQEALARNTAAQAAAVAAVQDKEAAYALLESLVRQTARFVQAYPATTNQDRAALGITVRQSRRSAVPAPGSAPLVVVARVERGAHTVRITDAANPTRRAKPRDADRALLFVAMAPAGAPAPSAESAYRFAALVADGTATLQFSPDHGGQQAHYLARWVNHRGEPGPWSAVTSGTVAA